MTDFFAHVENNQIIQANIRRGTVWEGRRLGNLSPDSTYQGLNLWPQVGEQPSHNPELETIEGPSYAVDELNQQVILSWTITAYPVQTVKERLQNANRQACKAKILEFYPLEIQISFLAGIYSEADTLTYSTFRNACIAEENRVFDLLEACSSIEQLLAIPEPNWPEV